MASPTRRHQSGPDEGYIGGSEEMRSVSEIDLSIQDDPMEDATDRVALEKYKVQTFLDGVSDKDLEPLLLALVRSLDKGQNFRLASLAVAKTSTASVAALVDQVHERLHIDPATKLPIEITEMVFDYLSPEDLLRCSRMSKTWRERVLDAKLWKSMFFREGWVTDADQIQHDIEKENARRNGNRSARRKLQGDIEANSSRKRQQRASIESISRGADARAWSEQHGHVEADEEHAMEGVEESRASHSRLVGEIQDLSPFAAGAVDDDTANHPSLNEDAHMERNIDEGIAPSIKPKLFEQSRPSARLNWLWLYKQRRRLEANWNNARYTTFQLPKPDHQEDAHEECVYTIQYNNDYLVSGSRDKTIKVWNLKTERCERTLRGQHDQSVLCLQFDQEQDIIVSGGSDSYVVIWKFSDGSVIRKMTTAHTESVLNLRFDDRYLVTCSKDKKIKIWNRHEISKNDPIIPAFVLPEFQGLAEPIKEYSLIATLHGHGAAVNAIQILGNHIVSASGDRSIILWDLDTGRQIRHFGGHTKGIACVQYDGRRIVSGSSDNTVRIFDAQTGAEVACLNQHNNLVRTLQARFGDMIDSPEELEKQAAAVDRRWSEARANGQLSGRTALGAARNAGSSDPRDICATGAKVPPGGGGSRWSRIVSGSYDETVIIWKRDHQGRWVCSRRLWQSEIFDLARNQQPRPTRQPRIPGAAQAGLPPFTHTQINGVPHVHTVGAAGAAAAGAAAAAPAPQPVVPHGNPAGHAHAQQTQTHHQQAPAQPQAAHPAAQNQILPNIHPVINLQMAAHQQAMMMRARTDDSNRVFKLQFDSRRIVCCSQNRMIVGWDFANADPELEEASRYFTETE